MNKYVAAFKYLLNCPDWLFDILAKVFQAKPRLFPREWALALQAVIAFAED